ncbi:MAG: hypothetical protein H0U46_06215, partial [Actinobacteria bacterium]|nr:hypothetical protein [Actinomycetota bacterium]
MARSLALLWWFLAAAAAILVVGAIALSSVLSNNLRDEALAVNADHVAVYTNTVLSPLLLHGDRVVIGDRGLRRLREVVRARGDITGVSVWSRKKRLLTSTSGRRPSARPPDEVADVLAGRGTQATLTELA